jgi:hypothetical protein
MGYSHYGNEVFFNSDNSKFWICGREDRRVILYVKVSAKINITGLGTGIMKIICFTSKNVLDAPNQLVINMCLDALLHIVNINFIIKENG